MPKRIINRVISGCQTGADEAGLAAAYALGIQTGGWMPFGYKRDDGYHPEFAVKYNLNQTKSSAYPPRTELNVQDSDCTVVFGNMQSPGCRLTLRLALKHDKELLHIQFDKDITRATVRLSAWLHNLAVNKFHTGNLTLNVAGNRERTNPGLYDFTYAVCLAAFKECY